MLYTKTRKQKLLWFVVKSLEKTNGFHKQHHKKNKLKFGFLLTDHPGYCYSEKEGVGSMELGEIKTQQGKCIEIECLEGGYIQYSRSV